jgi:hypothetical protein
MPTDFWTRRCDAIERQIDALVYDLYGLADEEIAIVEGRQGGAIALPAWRMWERGRRPLLYQPAPLRRRRDPHEPQRQLVRASSSALAGHAGT